MKVRAGIHKDIKHKASSFEPVSWRIIELFSEEWFVTGVMSNVRIARSAYDVAFIKPTERISEIFNVKKELILAFNTYQKFEPRNLDIFDKIRDINSSERFEEVCVIMVSNDNNIENNLKELTANNAETRIVVPFTFSELRKKGSTSMILNRMREYFFTRDLFAFYSPLQKDLYFFGRKEITSTVVSRHLSFENTGIFGLRKSGKTSILYAVKRTNDLRNSASVLVECEDTSILQRRWNEVLFYIVKSLYKDYKVEYEGIEENYTKKNASELFLQDLIDFKEKSGRKSILLLFDEVERITYGVSDIEHWRDDIDFVMLWRTIRANFQNAQNLFSYVLSSTNPTAVEASKFGTSENPIASHTENYYIGQFDVEQTYEMISKLGGFMGLNFDREIAAYLTRDYGGHPFLMRHVCSTINEISNSKRPTKVTRKTYQKAQSKFNSEVTKGEQFSDMILDVLQNYFEDEFKMLKALALGDQEKFDRFASKSPYYTKHLVGYGILEENEGVFDFKIDTLKEYLISKNRYQRVDLTDDQRSAEIAKRRKSIENDLRFMVRKQLKYNLSMQDARNEIINRIKNSTKKANAVNLSYKELFDPLKTEIYIKTLEAIMVKHWEASFRRIFNCSVDSFKANMHIFNEIRSAEAHSAMIDENLFDRFRATADWIEKITSEYIE